MNGNRRFAKLKIESKKCKISVFLNLLKNLETR